MLPFRPSVHRRGPWLALILFFLPASAVALTQATSSVDLFCSDGQLPNETINQSGPTPWE